MSQPRKSFKHGAWRWIKTQNESSMAHEIWALDEAAVATLGTQWVLKNYGPPTDASRAGSAFSGWRLVSGGPVGPAHDTIEDAAEYARVYLNCLAFQRRQSLQKQIDAIDAILCS